MVFVCILCSFRDVVAWGLKFYTSKKVRLNREPQSPLALMSNRASSSVVVELLTKLSTGNG